MAYNKLVQEIAAPLIKKILLPNGAAKTASQMKNIVGYWIPQIKRFTPWTNPYMSTPKKRFVELGLRTSSEQNPMPIGWKTFKQELKGKEGGKKRLGAQLLYFLTNIKLGKKGFYNSFAPIKDGKIQTYGGFVANPQFDSSRIPYYPQLEKGQFDLIDTFLYGKTPDPIFNLKKVDSKDFGVFDSYIKKNYPKKNIPIFELQDRDATVVPAKIVKITGNTAADDIVGTFEKAGDRLYTEYLPDVGGHQIEEGITLGGDKVFRNSDIWKFKPKDYTRKWLSGKNESTNTSTLKKLKEKLKAMGMYEVLKIVDSAGTPVITRTNWFKY